MNSKYGRLTVIAKSTKKTKDNRYLWLFRCDCGNYIERIFKQVNSGQTRSCGCLRREMAAKAVLKVQHLAAKAASVSNRKHGMRKTRFYRIWVGIKNRCLDREWNKYYGKKGIRVCERWKEFSNFMDDMLASYNEHVEKYGVKNTSIDRINTYGNYSKDNCRWATLSEQYYNQTNHPQKDKSGKFANNGSFQKYL